LSASAGLEIAHALAGKPPVAPDRVELRNLKNPGRARPIVDFSYVRRYKRTAQQALETMMHDRSVATDSECHTMALQSSNRGGTCT